VIGRYARDVLRCVECGAETEAGERWLAYLTVDDEAVVYCPECAEREFGPNSTSLDHVET
jgi:hypothetical protein